jgi:replication initiation protein RepC
MNPEGAANEPLIQNTSQRSIHIEYNDRRSAGGEQLDLPGTGLASEEGFRNEPERAASAEQGPQMLARPVDNITLMHLCPEFALFVIGSPTWGNIFEAADRAVRKILKVPDSTWRTACRLLGRERAAIALALIYEKQVAELIDNPGAYLNGMIDKAQHGKLDLPSSLFHWRKPRKNAPRRAERRNTPEANL